MGYNIARTSRNAMTVALLLSSGHLLFDTSRCRSDPLLLSF